MSVLKSKLTGLSDSNYKRVLIYGAGEAGVFLYSKMVKITGVCDSI